MSIEIIVLLLFSTVLIFLLISQYISKQKLQKKIYSLEHELNTLMLENNNSVLHKQCLKTDTNLDYIKKIEDLENRLKLEKKRINDVKAIAQEANQVKSEFLTNIRHEVRTPMNSIIVFADLISHELSDVKLKSYAKNIISSGEQLLNLIDEIIKLSSVESGAFKMKESPVDIRSLLSLIIEEKKTIADKKALYIVVNVDEDVPESIIIDKEKVEEIVRNLIENALKYTMEGGINIHVYIDGKNILNNTVNLSFEVKDTGIGIEEEYLGKIFEMFEKPHRNDDVQGIGLGLSINKKMANAMGGNLRVESTPNKGSLFILSLYDVEVALESKNSQNHENKIDFSLIDAPYKQFVIIDIENESKDVISEAFSKTEINIVKYDNPRDAIPFLQKETVDIVFIDIDILTADENAVAKILTKISKSVIVTLTSHRVKNVQFYDTIHLVGHLMKPIQLRQLFTITLQALEYEKNHFNFDDNKVVKKQLESLSQGTSQEREKFLDETVTMVAPLYEEATKTNNLIAIEKFAKQLQQSSKKYNIEDMYSFSKILLEKIALFDIDKIHTMMQEYKEKIESLKNL